jgi:hypothetical protein
MTPEPSDLLAAWERVLRELRGAAGAGSNEVGRAIATLVERQARLEQEVRARALAPVSAAWDLLEQTAGAMRAQATALDAAATSFKQAAEMLDLQASLLERTLQTMRDPVGTIRSAGASVARRPSPEPGAENTPE